MIAAMAEVGRLFEQGEYFVPEMLIAARAMQAGLNALYGLPVNDWKNYDAHIDAVTVADLQRFAQACFQRARRTQLVVRP